MGLGLGHGDSGAAVAYGAIAADSGGRGVVWGCDGMVGRAATVFLGVAAGFREAVARFGDAAAWLWSAAVGFEAPRR